MKMLRLILTIPTLLFCVLLSAQDLMLIESDDIKDDHVNITPTKLDNGDILSLAVRIERQNKRDNNMIPYSIFNDHRYYTNVTKEDDCYLILTDDELNILKAEDIKFKDADDVNVLDMITHEGRTVLYYTRRKSFDDYQYICAMEIDTDKYRRHKETVLHKINLTKGVPATRMILSPDGDKFAFISEKFLNNKDEQKLDIALYTIQGTPMWKDQVYLDKKKQQIELKDATIDNIGNIYVSYLEYDKYTNDKDQKVDGKKIPTYKTKVVTYGIDETEASLTLDTKDLFIRRCDIAFNESKDQVVVLGTYSIKDGGNVTGVYSSKINTTAFKADPVTVSKYSNELLLKLDEDGFANKKDKDPGVEYRDMETEICFKSNGDISYVMQPFRFDELYSNFNASRGNFNGNRVVESGYNVRSIIVSHHSDNDVLFTRIPRRMERRDAKPLIMAQVVSIDNKVMLIYPDSHKNMERRDDEGAAHAGEPLRENIILTLVDADGKYSRNYIKDRDEEKFIMSVGDIHAINAKQYLYTVNLGGFMSSKRYIGLMEFK